LDNHVLRYYDGGKERLDGNEDKLDRAKKNVVIFAVFFVLTFLLSVLLAVLLLRQQNKPTKVENVAEGRAYTGEKYNYVP